MKVYYSQLVHNVKIPKLQYIIWAFSKNIFKWAKTNLIFCQSLNMVLGAIQGFGGLIWYSFSESKSMLKLKPGLFVLM